MKRSGVADLPLHSGRVPAWLAERMLTLGSAIVESVIYHSAPCTAFSRFNNAIDRAIMAFMKKASITEARNNLSALIDGLKRGSGVLIVDRGRPVARLEPVTSGHDEEKAEGRLARLIRDGVVRPGRAVLPKTLTDARPPSPKRGTSAVRVLLEDRRQGR
jgi:prevent-host-death family protein